MTSPGAQFEKAMKQWADKALSKMAVELNEEVVRQMNENVDRGETFKGETFKRNYAERTIADRRRLGFQVSRVDLQRRRRRIKHTHTHSTGRGVAQTRFLSQTDRRGQNAGVIMHAHHTGEGKLPIRRIFPTKHKTVPKLALEKAAAKGKEVFDGV